MVSLTALWLPIVISAVVVFIASAIIHMVLTYHRSDFGGMPDESKVMDAIRDAGVQPGDYMFPHCKTMAELGTPEMTEKHTRGPVGLLTVRPSGPPTMTKNLIQWFIYTLVVGVLVAYVTSRTVAAGAEYLTIFRVAGVAAFLCYAGAEPLNSIWMSRKWSTTIKHIVDGLIYALLTAGSFAGFYPG